MFRLERERVLQEIDQADLKSTSSAASARGRLMAIDRWTSRDQPQDAVYSLRVGCILGCVEWVLIQELREEKINRVPFFLIGHR